EFPHLLNMVQQNQFDTAYHEHFSYLSLTAVQRIFSANGLNIFDVENLVTHGGSLRVFAQTGNVHSLSIRVQDNLDRERNQGMLTLDFYRHFQKQAEKVKDDLLVYLVQCKRQGLKVAAYGAAAKGNTLLNFAGVKSDLIAYVVDKNTQKQGKFLPGSRLAIVDEAYLKMDKPDRVVIFPWNLREEICHDLSYIRDWSGQFVMAVPSLIEQVITKE
ncbi:MAG: SAM-dependent methyltransferase, partial [Undibacterium sp.]|nr:SAM-dependent methyltransferase [Undibacterium sp.]